ncbi:hypothetical protein D3C75_1108110 [compost metagenome]
MDKRLHDFTAQLKKQLLDIRLPQLPVNRRPGNLPYGPEALLSVCLQQCLQQLGFQLIRIVVSFFLGLPVAKDTVWQNFAFSDVHFQIQRFQGIPVG